MNEKMYRTSVVVLLTLILVVLAYNVFIPRLTNSEQEERISLIVGVMSIMADNTQDIIDRYDDVAYGPNVDRIAEQQLLATETTNDLLGQLAQQFVFFSELVDVLYGTPPETD